MCISLMKLWLIRIILLISICSFAKFKQVYKSQMKENKTNVEKERNTVSFSNVPAVNAMHYRDTKQAITA